LSASTQGLGALHHIENIGTDEWHFLIFFDPPFPADIGYRASASAYSREVLSAATAARSVSSRADEN
jgi:hypothetical protein